MTFRMIPDPQEDEDFARWLLMQPPRQQQPDREFPQLYPDPTKHPTALEADTTRRPAYGDPERPREELPDEYPSGVVPPEYWKGPAADAQRARAGAPAAEASEPAEAVAAAERAADSAGLDAARKVFGYGANGSSPPLPDKTATAPAGSHWTDASIPQGEPINAQQPPTQSPAPAPGDRPLRPEARPGARPTQATQAAGPSTYDAFRDRQRDKAQAQPSYAAPSGGGGDDFSIGEDGGMILAMFADLMINKGRGGDEIIKYYKERQGGGSMEALNRRYKMAQIRNLESGGGLRGQSPEQIANARTRLAQADRRLDINEKGYELAEDRAELMAEKWKALNTVGSPQQQAMVDFAASHGIPRAEIENMTADQASEAWPALNAYLRSTGPIGAAITKHEADTARASGYATIAPKAETARRVSAATLPDDIVRAQAAAGVHIDRTRQEETRKLRVNSAGAIAKLRVLRGRAELRDPSSKIPMQEGILKQWYTKGIATWSGGSGMNTEDTNLVRSIESAALGAYIADAGNAPNTDPERATAFGKFMSDGTIGGLLDVIDNEIMLIEEKLQAQEGAMGSGDAPRRGGRRVKKVSGGHSLGGL